MLIVLLYRHGLISKCLKPFPDRFDVIIRASAALAPTDEALLHRLLWAVKDENPSHAEIVARLLLPEEGVGGCYRMRKVVGGCRR
jgi:hypothetical protein